MKWGVLCRTPPTARALRASESRFARCWLLMEDF